MQIAQFAPKWPQRLVGLLQRIKRIGADQLSAILLGFHSTARDDFRNALGVDFDAYNTNPSKAMGRADFIRYIGDAFPGMFSREFAESLFDEGAKLPARTGRNLSTEAGVVSAESNEEEDGDEGEGGDGEDDDGAAATAAEIPPRPTTTESSVDRSVAQGSQSMGRSKRVLPLSPDAWNLQQFMCHMSAITENVML